MVTTQCTSLPASRVMGHASRCWSCEPDEHWPVVARLTIVDTRTRRTTGRDLCAVHVNWEILFAFTYPVHVITTARPAHPGVTGEGLVTMFPALAGISGLPGDPLPPGAGLDWPPHPALADAAYAMVTAAPSYGRATDFLSRPEDHQPARPRPARKPRLRKPRRRGGKRR